MSTITFTAMPTEDVKAAREGRPDANGQRPERSIAEGSFPCRACLGKIKAGEEMLLLAYRPFQHLHAYAETGPIFIHAEACEPEGTQESRPAMLDSPDYIIRGYSAEDRIVYGTGAVTPVMKIAERAGELLMRDDVAYVHVRSARNNCFQCRIDPA